MFLLIKITRFILYNSITDIFTKLFYKKMFILRYNHFGAHVDIRIKNLYTTLSQNSNNSCLHIVETTFFILENFATLYKIIKKLAYNSSENQSTVGYLIICKAYPN